MGFLSGFIVMLVFLGLFSLVYISFDEAYGHVFTFAQANIVDTDSIRTMNILNIFWIYIPLLVLVSFIIWAIRRPTKDSDIFR